MAFSSGIGTCIRQLVPLLNRFPFRICLLVAQKDQLWCKNIEQIVFSAPVYSLSEQIQFPFKIPKCDLFWSPHYNIPIQPIRARKRIVTIHDACHLALPQYLSSLERIYAKLVMKAAFSFSDGIITDSFFSKNELIRFMGKPKSPFNVISPAVNQTQFRK
ncbi:MAG: glycosyltransferase family 1 protein, partial [Chlamydiota bacterium]